MSSGGLDALIRFVTEANELFADMEWIEGDVGRVEYNLADMPPMLWRNLTTGDLTFGYPEDDPPDWDAEAWGCQ